MSYKIIGCIFVCIIMASPLRSQSVEGRIIDDKNLPLEGITSVVLQADDSSYVTGGITTVNGSFSLSLPRPGKFILQFSCIGYKKLNVSFLLVRKEKKQLGDIRLNEEAYVLNGVTATAAKPQMELSASNIVVNLSSSILSSEGTLFDALKRIPGIMVRDDGTILINGQTGATVMINGKPTYLSGSSLAGYLQTIPASSIGKIELVSTPSVQYDAGGKTGLIKIEMSKNTTQGIMSSYNVGYQQYKIYSKGNGGVTFQMCKDKLNFSSNYAYYQGTDFHPAIIFRNHTDYDKALVTPLLLNQAAHRTSDYKVHYLRLSVDYDFSPRFSIALYSSNSWADRLDKETMVSAFTSVSLEADSVLTTWNRDKAFQTNRQGGINMTYKSTKQLQWDTSFDFQHYNSPDNQDQNDLFNIASKKGMETRDTLNGDLKANIRIYTAQTEVSAPLNYNIKWIGGFKTSFVRNDNITTYENREGGVWIPNLGMSNHFLYKEAVYAGYIQLQGKVGENNRFETGFRIEHTHINGNMLEYASLSDSAFYDRYTNFFPFMLMEYLLPDKARLAITYGSRIVRPNYKDLNPFVSINDRYLFNQGNVNLKPEISQQLELALLLKKRYRIVVFGTYTHNPISKSYYSDDNNRACVYPLNLSSDYACGIRLTGINLHPWPWWTINANAVCIYKKYAWLNEKKKYDNEVITPMLYAGNQYKITHGWSAEVNGYWNGKTPMGQGLIKPLWSVSIAISKSILEGNGSIRLFADDAFSSRCTNVKIVSFGQEAWYKDDKHAMLGISFLYKFHSGKEMKDSHTKKEIIESKRITL
ncbi:MAG: outer membrane beta-barrel family protein [Parabacteroides sp.]